MKEVEEYIKELKDTHQEILKILELPPSILQKKIKKWTVKDAIAHIISWRKEILKILKKVIKEKEPEWDYFLKTQDDLDKWNEKEIGKRKNMTEAELKEELETLLKEWNSFLKNIDDMLEREFQPPWEGKTTIRECVEIEIGHSKGHLERIKDLINSLNI
jgi:uncharacterized damage-inducible protein DinB